MEPSAHESLLQYFDVIHLPVCAEPHTPIDKELGWMDGWKDMLFDAVMWGSKEKVIRNAMPK